MKNSTESSLDFDAIWTWLGGILLLLSPFIILWLIGTSSPPSEENNMTPQEAAQYEDYKSDQLLNANAEQEACMDQMARDVERYGESVIDTYDCSQ